MNTKLIEDLKNNVVAVVRIKDKDLAREVTEQVIAGGFKFIELTLSINNGCDLIKELSEKYKNTGIYIGAGTVLNISDCKKVIDSGATFVVSPFTDQESIEYAIKNNVPMLPGIGTVTEANFCNKLGCEIVKVFPGDVLGANFIKSALAPLPHIKFMPSGGVNFENMGDWFAKGAYAISVGSALYTGVTMDNLELAKERATQYVNNLPK